MVKNGVIDLRRSVGWLSNGITRSTIFHIATRPEIGCKAHHARRGCYSRRRSLLHWHTAAEVTPSAELDRIELGKGRLRGQPWPHHRKIQTAFFDIVNGRNPQYTHWLTKV